MDLAASLRLVALASYRSSTHYHAAPIPLNRIASFVTNTCLARQIKPTSSFTICIETPAGVHRARLTQLTPDDTVKNVQQAYCEAQLIAYLQTCGIAVPDATGAMRVVNECIDHAGNIRISVLKRHLESPTAPIGVERIVRAVSNEPAFFADYFAIQFSRPDAPDRLLLETQTLGSLGLAPNTPLPLFVTIRPDRANYDAARKLSTDNRERISCWRVLQTRCHILSWGAQTIVYNICSRKYELADDPAVAIRLVQTNGAVLQYLHANLRGDYHIVLAAVQSNPEALKYASLHLRSNRQIVLAAAHKRPRAIR
jgi:hypothetical protein